MFGLNKVQGAAWTVLSDQLTPIVPYTAIGEVSSDVDASLPSEPIEGGQLAAYNVVRQPQRATVEFLFSGDYAVQTLALAMLDLRIRKAETCTIFTPAKIFRNMALEHYDFVRSQNSGANFLSVHCSFIEIVSVNLASAKVAYSPKNPTSVGKVNTGMKSNSLFKDTLIKLRG